MTRPILTTPETDADPNAMPIAFVAIGMSLTLLLLVVYFTECRSPRARER